MIQKIKEKRTIPQKAKEKIQSAPKELLRRGLLDGTEKLRGQMRDAAEGGQRKETEVERAQGKARIASQQAVRKLGRLLHKKEKTWSGTIEPGPDIHESSSAAALNNQPAAKGLVVVCLLDMTCPTPSALMCPKSR